MESPQAYGITRQRVFVLRIDAMHHFVMITYRRQAADYMYALRHDLLGNRGETMYDLEKLSWIIADRRKRFKLWLALYVCIFIAGAVLFFFEDKNVVFVGIILAVISIFLTVRLWRRYSASVLFSKEIRGVNIKEHEYVQSARGGYSVKRGFAMRTVKTHSNSGNAKSKRPHVHAAYIYVREENGNVVILDGLTSRQTDIYEIGDEVLRPSGARYPIVMSREPDRQPCPLCGRINGMDEESCPSCGLTILKK